MTEEETNMVTKFIGDIVFNNGEEDIKVSDLATVDEVNDALSQYVKKDVIDSVHNVFNNVENSPTSPLIPNNEFIYDDTHVMSSLAVKTLVDESMTGSGDNNKFDSLTITGKSNKLNLTVTPSEDEAYYIFISFSRITITKKL